MVIHKLKGTFFALPTGNRAQKAFDVAKEWKNVGIEVVAYCWDDETYSLLKKVTPYLSRGKRKSFAILQNLMAKHTIGWDCMICGSDDLYPVDVEQLKDTYELFPGKILWADDNIHRWSITHPVITRGWYDKNKSIFDERFTHSYCDKDLFIRASQKGEIVKCFNIVFNHRHFLVTGEPLDKINKIAQDAFEEDSLKFGLKYKDESSVLGFVPTYSN